MDGQAWALIIAAVFSGVVALIGATVSAVVAILTFLRQGRLAAAVVPIAQDIATLKEQTNHIKDALVAATATGSELTGRADQYAASRRGEGLLATPLTTVPPVAPATAPAVEITTTTPKP